MKDEALNKIHSHERECTIRYENLEKRLEEGSKRFVRIELLIYGLYAGMAAIEITSRFVWNYLLQNLHMMKKDTQDLL